MSEQPIQKHNYKSELYHKLMSCNHDLSKINDILNRPVKFKECFTLKEIGKILGISNERVRQIEKSALRKIKYPSKQIMGLKDALINIVYLENTYAGIDGETENLMLHQ